VKKKFGGEGLIIAQEVWRDLGVSGGKAPCKHGGYTGERLGRRKEESHPKTIRALQIKKTRKKTDMGTAFIAVLSTRGSPVMPAMWVTPPKTRGIFGGDAFL